ncbi:MAG TPA: molybdopterin-binding protein [Candidatus Binatia bacterium]|jgi:DMSO/TMAO reductase YedYZ molybdopterin-dependent catalytic subunit
MTKSGPEITRRKILTGALYGAALLGISGCDKFFNRLQQNRKVEALLDSAETASRGFLRLLTGRRRLAQEFEEKDISRYFKPNGNPPPLENEYITDANAGWASWRLEIGGMVERPARLTLEELKDLPARTQITRHDCVEGWSAIAKWKGVPLARLIARVIPAPAARYVVFHCMDRDDNGELYYESIDMRDARHPQTILAYEMNGAPLAVEHGAPLRLRVETQLGYKMAKYIRRIEFVADLKKTARGKGGYWEDRGYEWYAGI